MPRLKVGRLTTPVSCIASRTWSMPTPWRSSPGSSSAATRVGASLGWTEIDRRPSCSRRKPTSGRASANRFTASTQAAYSARGERRNLRRAGILSNSPSTRTRVPGGTAAGPSPASAPWSIAIRQPSLLPRSRLSIVRRETLAIDGSASPRKPKLVTFSICSSGNFEVAWRSSASAISDGAIPQPSSLTSTRSSPPADSRTATWVAPASSAFSTSSLSALAGRSTTSPAAMRSISPEGSLLIDIVRCPSPIGMPSRSADFSTTSRAFHGFGVNLG